MPFKYRDTLRGREVSVPEPREVEASAADPARGKWLAMHQARTIHKMDASTRWERLDNTPSQDPPVVAEPVPTDDEQDAPAVAEASAETVDRPAQADPKASWIDWAVTAHGLSQDVAETMTKQELQQL